ncbi:MAG: O-antigen ligase family protein [Bacteroidota bacterium]
MPLHKQIHIDLRTVVALVLGLALLGWVVGMYFTLPTIKSVIYYERAAWLVYGSGVLLAGAALLSGRRNGQLLQLPSQVWTLAVVYACFLLVQTFLLNGEVGLSALAQISTLATFGALLSIFRHYGKSAIWAMAAVLLGLLSIVVLHGCSQIFGLADRSTHLAAASGYYNNPAPFAAILIAGLPLAIHFSIQFLKTETTEQCWLWLLGTWVLALSFGGILLVLKLDSRSAMLSIIMSSSFVLLYHFGAIFKRFFQNPRTRKALLAAAIVIPFIIMIGLFYMRPASATGRLLIWKITLTELVSELPIWGGGLDYFRQFYAQAQADYFASGKGTSAEMLNVAYSPYAFNEYLKILVEQGIIGLILFLLIIGIALRSAAYSLWNKAGENRNLLVGSTAALIGILVFAFFSYPLNDPLMLFQLFAVLAITIGSASPSATTTDLDAKAASSLRIGASVVVSVFLVFQAYPQEKAYEAWRNRYLNHPIEAEQLSYLEQLSPQLSKEGWFLADLAEVYHNNKQTEHALTLLLTATEYTADPNIYLKIGQYAQQLKQYETAAGAYRKVVDMLPYKFYPRQMLMHAYSSAGEQRKAHQVAQSILNLPVKVPSLAVDKIKADAQELLGG